MNRHSLRLVLALAAALAGATAARASDVVTVPVATQLKGGEVELALHHIELNLPKPGPQHASIQALYVGVTDTLELSVQRLDVDNDSDNTIWNFSYKVLDEGTISPDLVIGARDLTGEIASTSYYVAVAKTLNAPSIGRATLPVVRGHIAMGTADNTLLGETRHEGFFGGLEVLLRTEPKVGAFALHDGEDFVTGLSFTPGPLLPTLKGGTFGSHWWLGLSYTIRSPVK